MSILQDINSNNWPSTYSFGQQSKSVEDYLTLELPLNASGGTLNTTDYSGIVGSKQIVKQKTITNVSVTAKSDFGKYYGSSASFTGSSYVTTSSSDYVFGTGNFTVECFVYFNNSETYQDIFSTASYGSNNLSVRRNNSNQLQYYINDGSVSLFSAGSLVSNTWYHIAVTRSSNTIRLFINGISVYSGTESYNLSSSDAFTIGSIAGNSYYLNGYIQDFRVYKGLAKYTSDFTPPTQIIDPITNTLLPDSNSANLVLALPFNSANPFNTDFSKTNKKITNSAASVSTSTSKYYGSSASFNGSSSYLYTAASNDFAFSTGDYTIEFWINPNNSADFTIFDTQGSGGNAQISRISGALYHGSATTWSYTFTSGTWTHIAFSRVGSSLSLFANGVLIQTQTNSNVVGSGANTATIGLRTDNYYPFNGYLQDLRIYKGVGKYTSNFTPPAQILNTLTNKLDTDPYYNNLVLAIPFRGTQTDYSPSSKVVTNSNVTTFGTKYYLSSASFNGTSSYIEIPNTSDFNFGDKNFTVEMWVNSNSGSGSRRNLYWGGNSAGQDSSANLFFEISASNVLRAGVATNSTYSFASGSTTINLNTWYHVAVVRNGNNLYGYVNGVLEFTASASGTANVNTSPIQIGGVRLSNVFGGYIQDFRIYSGIAKYTSNFIPPNQALLGA